MPTPAELTQALMQSFPFDEDDLTANRKRQLSARQQARLHQRGQRRRRRQLILTALVVPFGVCGGIFPFLTGVPLRDMPAIALIMAGVLSLSALVVAIHGWYWSRIFRGWSQRAVSVIEGPIRFGGWREINDEWVGAIRIGKVTFFTPVGVAEAFNFHTQYRLYYIPYPPENTLLSVEPMPDTTPEGSFVPPSGPPPFSTPAQGDRGDTRSSHSAPD